MTKSRLIKTATAVVCAAVVFIGGAGAQSLKELRGRESEESALDREVAYTQSVCDNNISASIDWRSAADWPPSASLVASCDGALGALEAFCKTDRGRSRAQRITRFTCSGDGAGASVSGGELEYGAEPGGNGFADTMAVLEGEL